MPNVIRNFDGSPSFTTRPVDTKMPKIVTTPDMAYPKIFETSTGFNDHFPCSLNRNGIETHTDTGPFFIIAGVKTHCIAASCAG